MKLVEALVSMPVLASFAAGASLVVGTEAAPAIARNGVDGISAASPVFALGVIAALLASGLYLIVREMRLEAQDHQDKRYF